MNSNSHSVGSDGIAHEPLDSNRESIRDERNNDPVSFKRSYWYDLGEQYDTFKQYNRYETGH